MKEEIRMLATVFRLQGEVTGIHPIKNGHINATYDVIMQDGETEKRYVFQKMNLFVFKKPEQIMENIAKITSHIAKKLDEEGKDPDGVLHFFCTAEGKNYYITEDGCFWRVMEYVANTVTHNSCENLRAFRSAGKAFGEFQIMLSDFDATLLHETIPGFHDTRARFALFLRHVEEDPCGRVAQVRDEIARIKAYEPLIVRLNEMIDKKALPLRVTHNDTKINNVLFDRDTDEAKVVIDLDTVMPGLVAHDFGDAIRFAANTAAEDEADLSKVSLDLDRFRAFAEGFLAPLKTTLTPLEIQTLSLGAFTMTIELVIRFLDDYITGDQYFKIQYPTHNLVRARCQLCLADRIQEKLPELNRIIEKIAQTDLSEKR